MFIASARNTAPSAAPISEQIMIPFARTPSTRTAPACVVSRASEPAPDGPRISVVIPTCRRPELLCRCLAGLLAQRIEPGAFEVIVADDGRSADTEAVVETFRLRPGAPVLRLVRPRQGHGPAAARNAGWRSAYGKVIAFTDDDTVPDPDWLARGEGALVPGLVALCGPVDSPPRPGSGGGEAASADPCSPQRTVRSMGFASANAFVRRSALLTLGGFDERFQRAGREDSDLQLRLLRDAGPVGFSADAVVLRPRREEAWETCLGQQQDAFFDALLYKKHPGLLRERMLPTPPWDHYFIVALSLAAFPLWLADIAGSAVVSLLLATIGVLRLTVRRLSPASRSVEQVAGMLATSVLIPFLSVYWRLRGAIHFRVLFL